MFQSLLLNNFFDEYLIFKTLTTTNSFGVKKQTLYTPKSVTIISILFSIHFLCC